MIASRRVISRRSHGRMRKFRKPSMTICPARVPVSVEDCPAHSSATANSTPASVVAQQRRQQLVRLLDLGHHDAALEEHRRRQDQDGRVDEEGAVQRDHRVDQVVAAGRRAWPCRSCADAAASAPAPSAGTGCAASPSRRGCRWRRTGCRRSGAGTRPVSTSPSVGLRPGRSRRRSRRRSTVISDRMNASIVRMPQRLQKQEQQRVGGGDQHAPPAAACRTAG